MKNIFRVSGKMDIGSLIISLLISEGLGFIAGIFNKNYIMLYETVKKPSFTPPAIVFPIVWTILYALMAIAAYRVYMAGKDDKSYRRPITFYAIQLILNIIWPFVFFRFRLYGLAFIILIALIVMVFVTAVLFYKTDRTAGILMIPYILWLMFAAVLNFFVWKYNEM